MKMIISMIYILCVTSLYAQELKIVADVFEGNETKGISFFKGNVKISKGLDELNASSVYVFTSKDRKPIKYSAEGNVTINIVTKSGAHYSGRADKVIFNPESEKYEFYDNVRLEQIDQKKKIIGDAVIVDIKNGTAIAKGDEKKPVIMIFDVKDQNKTKLK